MKLMMSPTSPYARIVRTVLIEKGLADEVEMTPIDPWKSDPSLVAANPFSRIPVLTTDDGEELTESLLIADYLEHRHPTPQLMPESRRAVGYAKAGLGIGLIDSSVAVVAAKKFDPEAETNGLIKRRRAGLEKALPTIANITLGDTDRPDLGDLVIAIGLEYLTFRMPQLNWRAAHTSLAAWAHRIAHRPSLAQTAPPS